MILSHFSAKPFKFNRRKSYKLGAKGQFEPMKPFGLWLSDESDFGWKQWCEGEQWNTEAFAHRTDFVVKDKSQWLILDTQKKILEFTEEFRVKDDKFAMLRSIRWTDVQDQYAGILISPYQWSLRLSNECFWYYGWDCASACVWDLKTVEVVK